MKSEIRIDKWLWAVRVFKTRTVATDSCKKGRVMIATPAGDVVAKPSRMIHVGETVRVRKPPITYSFKVLALTENRLGAKLVPEYLENVTTKDQYDLLDVIRAQGFIDRRKGLGRPTKREGRKLHEFTVDFYAGPSMVSWQSEDGWDFDDGNENGWDFDESDFND